MDLVAKKSFRYNGRDLAPGDPFEAVTARDFKILKAVGRAGDPEKAHERVKDQAPAPSAKQNYQRRDLRAKD